MIFFSSLSTFLLLSLQFLAISSELKKCFDEVILHRQHSLLPSNDLFCILKDQVEIEFEDVPIITTEQEMDEYLMENRLFEEENGERSNYLTLSYSDDIPFTIPWKTFSDKCVGSVGVELHHNFTSSCIPSWLVFNETECLGNEYFDATKLLRNISIGGNNTNSNLYEVNFISAIPLNTVRWIEGTCRGVIEELELLIITNKSEVVHAEVVHLTYVTIGENNYTTVPQTFTVRFVEWKERRIELRGYRQDERLRVKMEKAESGVLSNWMLPKGENCEEGNEMEVKFNRMISTGCMIRPSSCSSAVSSIRTVLDHFHPLEVLSLPTTNVTVPVHFRNQTSREMGEVSPNSCALVTFVSIEVAYAKQGSERNYHEKIVSVVFYYTVEEVEIVENMPIVLLYNLKFVDVTRDPSSYFASLPKIDLRLPNDFFYPFSFSSDSPASSSSFIPLLLSFILFINVF